MQNSEENDIFTKEEQNLIELVVDVCNLMLSYSSQLAKLYPWRKITGDHMKKDDIDDVCNTKEKQNKELFYIFLN